MGADQDSLELGPGGRLLGIKTIDLRGFRVIQIAAFFYFIYKGFSQTRITDIASYPVNDVVRASWETQRRGQVGSAQHI
jgi:hypothetical protein